MPESIEVYDFAKHNKGQEGHLGTLSPYDFGLLCVGPIASCLVTQGVPNAQERQKMDFVGAAIQGRNLSRCICSDRNLPQMNAEWKKPQVVWENKMGGFGSGRKFGTPTVEAGLILDLSWMLRSGLIKRGANVTGHLTWTGRSGRVTVIGYTAFMAEPGAERLELSLASSTNRQTVRLSITVPNFGGKRWWMICPISSSRVNKLYLPRDTDRFASRNAYNLHYRSERVTKQQRALDRLFELQLKLGCPKGLGVPPPARPRCMWQRTYQRHLYRYQQLEKAAAATFSIAVKKFTSF